ncbi:MAG: response regulator, partial [Magnetovibrio sp.]|nr:response regulator [Magnetovibrio sp.]
AAVPLVDLSMPDMGGAEMMRHLASRQFQGSIILVSGADADTIMVAQELAKTRGLDVLGSISKPLTKQALAEALAGRT